MSGHLNEIGSVVAGSRRLDPALHDRLQIPAYGVGWYRDPVRRDGFRFFDGGKWTPTVINRDVDQQTELRSKGVS